MKTLTILLAMVASLLFGAAQAADVRGCVSEAGRKVCFPPHQASSELTNKEVAKQKARAEAAKAKKEAKAE